MASNKKISDLTAVTTPADSDLWVIVQGGTNYKETGTQLKAYLKTYNDTLYFLKTLCPWDCTLGDSGADYTSLNAMNTAGKKRPLLIGNLTTALTGNLTLPAGFILYSTSRSNTITLGNTYILTLTNGSNTAPLLFNDCSIVGTKTTGDGSIDGDSAHRATFENCNITLAIWQYSYDMLINCEMTITSNTANGTGNSLFKVNNVKITYTNGSGDCYITATGDNLTISATGMRPFIGNSLEMQLSNLNILAASSVVIGGTTYTTQIDNIYMPTISMGATYFSKIGSIICKNWINNNTIVNSYIDNITFTDTNSFSLPLGGSAIGTIKTASDLTISYSAANWGWDSSINNLFAGVFGTSKTLTIESGCTNIIINNYFGTAPVNNSTSCEIISQNTFTAAIP